MVLSSLNAHIRTIFRWIIRLLRAQLSTIKRKTIAACAIIFIVFYGFWLDHYWGQMIILPFEVGHGWKSEDGNGLAIDFASAMTYWSKSRCEPLLIRQHINIPIGMHAVNKEKNRDVFCSALFEPLFYVMQNDESLVLDFSKQYSPSGKEPQTPGKATQTHTPNTLGSQGPPKSLETPVGEIPLEFLNKLLLGKISLNTIIYTGSISTIGDCLTINIDRLRPNRKSWTVSGPTSTRAELFNILALSTCLEQYNLPIKDLAFSLGFEEMRQNHFQKAVNYFDIVLRLAPNDRDTAGLLGIVLYELYKEHRGPTNYSTGSEKNIVGNAINSDTYLNRAVNALKLAAKSDLDSPSQPWLDYLSCILSEIDPKNVESGLYNHIINSIHPIDMLLLLKLRPLSGVEHYLSLTDQGVEAFVNSAIKSFDGNKFINSMPLPVKPRQIISHPKYDHPLILSEDGSLFTLLTEEREGTTNYHYLYQNRSLPIKQVVRGEKNDALFLVNIVGQIIKLPLNDMIEEELYFDRLPPVRQLVVQDEIFYFLAEDGSIWKAPLENKQASPLTSPASVREIAIKKSSVGSRLPLAIFALMENGNIWSYQERTRLRLPKLNIYDTGINTRQIVATKSKIYVLKYNGEVWCRDINDPDSQWIRLMKNMNGHFFKEILAKEESFEVTDIFLLADSELCVIKDKSDAKTNNVEQSVTMHCFSTVTNRDP